MLLPWLAFTFKGVEDGWLARCQFKVTGWGIMLIYGMVLRCAGTLKIWLQSGPVTADLTTTVVHSSKLLINDVKPHQSLTHIYGLTSHSSDLFHSVF